MHLDIIFSRPNKTTFSEKNISRIRVICVQEYEVIKIHHVPIMLWTVKTLVRLGGWPGCLESAGCPCHFELSINI